MIKKLTDSKEFSTKQVIALEQLSINADVESVSKAVGVSRTTVYKWLQKDNFRKKLIELRSDILDENIDKIKIHCEKALKKIVELMNSENDTIALKSAMYLIDKALESKALQEFEKRITELETKITQEK